MVGHVFGHRSGRAIAAARITLATLYVTVLLIDPNARAAGKALLALAGAYAIFSAAVLIVTWRDWWLECRLAVPAHVIDISVALLLIFLTGGYASPFIGFSVFVVLTAAIRWRPRGALLTTAIVVLTSMLAIFAADQPPAIQFGPLRYFVRSINLLVIALLVIWFGQNQFAVMRARFRSIRLEASVAPTPPAAEALEFAADCLGARRAQLVWADADEPWLHLATFEDGALDEQRLAPDAWPELFESSASNEPFLFDLEQRRNLGLYDGCKRLSGSIALPRDFAVEQGFPDGLAIPIRTSRHEALLLLCAIDGLCSDDLPFAAKVGDQIAMAFERAASLSANRDASSVEARLALARDLHDGGIQFLAGIGLRLRVAKSAAGDPAAVRDQLGAIERDILDQQKDLRDLIQKLREPGSTATGTDLCKHLATLCRRLAGQWDAAIELSSCLGSGTIGPVVRYELDQLVREAVSNAVRHGAARLVRVEATVADGWLELAVIDDGGGFPFNGAMSDEQLSAREDGPRTLHERLRRRGGSLRIESSARGARVEMRLRLDPGA